jgi:hypothetical protein
MDSTKKGGGKVKRKLLAAAAGALLMAGGVVYAAKPANNVGKRHHPNIHAAQVHAREAWNKIVAAQKANEWDMEGHAQKAKELLDQVNNELKIAAGEANENAGH